MDTLIDVGRSVSEATKNAFRNASRGVLPPGLLSSSILDLRIPCNIYEENKAYMMLSGYRLGYMLATTPSGVVVTPGLALAVGALHARPGGYSALSTSLSPYRILEKRESMRYFTGQMIHSTTTGLLYNLSELYEAAAHLESSWGWRAMLASCFFVSSLGQSIYGACFMCKMPYLT